MVLRQRTNAHIQQQLQAALRANYPDNISKADEAEEFTDPTAPVRPFKFTGKKNNGKGNVHAGGGAVLTDTDEIEERRRILLRRYR